MRIYLVQHGEAVSEEVDPNRPLSDKGRSDVKKVARHLKRQKMEVSKIWYSTKLRAMQTAQIIAKAVPPKDIAERMGLAPNDPPEKISDEIQAENQDLMIVSHLPFLAKLASLLVTGSDSLQVVSFRQGGVVCLERINQGDFNVVWVLLPDLIS